MVDASFHAVDYVLFILVLVISAGIGIMFAWRDRNKQTSEEFLLGGRSMGVVPVSLSLMATLLSAVMVLGVPAEVYYNGSIYWLILFSNVLVYPVTAHMFLPVYHKLGITSAYEYLELRFNPLVRILGCIVFQLQMTLSMSMGLFAPAIALNQVMDISMLVSILVIGAICTFYTAIGGLKAVIWTDAFQMVIIMAGILAVLIQGTTETGGFSNVWNTAREAGKLDFNNFNPSLTERHTFWSLTIGAGITTLTVYAGNQAMVQRYLSMESIKKAQIALYLQLPAGVIVTSIFVYGGLLLVARYPSNPIADCTIQYPDQLIPWMVMDVLGDFHGFPGLLLACLFSASLSTVSSGINAIALVFMADIVQPAHLHLTGRVLPEFKATIISKVIAVISGAVTIGLAFVAEEFGDLILQIALSFYGMIGGPLLGVFICAMFIPLVNSWGAILGMFASLGMTCWLSIGAILMYRENSPPPPVCPSGDSITSNMTSLMTSAATTVMNNVTSGMPASMDVEKTNLETFYSMSYLWYSAFAVTIVIVVAVPVSCLTGGTKHKPVDEKLLSPAYHFVRKLIRVRYDEDKYMIHDDRSYNGDLPRAKAGITNPGFTTKM